MKPKTTLEELLKPPFHQGNESSRSFTFDCSKTHDRPLIQVLDYRFHNVKKGSERFNEFRDWVNKTINEGWKRDFGEPQRWEYSASDSYYDSCHLFTCPKCGYEMRFNGEWWEKREITEDFNYCPKCGVKLSKPEGC